MKCKKVSAIFMAITMLFTVCFATMSVSAAELETEEGWEVIEFSVNEDGTIDMDSVQPRNSNFIQTVTALPEEFGGAAWTASNSNLTVVARASNTGSSVSIHLRKKGLLNQYYKVSGSSVTLPCDGVNHTLYSGFDISAGETYKFYYKSNGGNTHTPDVTMSCVIWD